MGKGARPDMNHRQDKELIQATGSVQEKANNTCFKQTEANGIIITHCLPWQCGILTDECKEAMPE